MGQTKIASTLAGCRGSAARHPAVFALGVVWVAVVLALAAATFAHSPSNATAVSHTASPHSTPAATGTGAMQMGTEPSGAAAPMQMGPGTMGSVPTASTATAPASTVPQMNGMPGTPSMGTGDGLDDMPPGGQDSQDPGGQG